MRSEIALLLLCGLTLMSGGCDRRSGENGQGGSNATANAANGSAASTPTSGEVTPGEVKDSGEKGVFKAVLDRSHKGSDAPDVVFRDPAGKDVSLADYKGKPVLVNLWATWCGPCVAEMPMLDTLAEHYKARGLVVMTVSQDSGAQEQITAFFARHKLPHLAAWRDPENQLGFHYATGVLPTTVLYDREGKEVARVAGAMDWSSDEGQALIEDLLE